MWRNLINTLHKNIAKSNYLIKLALLIRNQSNAIIRYHLGEDTEMEKNGESLFLAATSKNIKIFLDVGANRGLYTENLISLNQSLQRAYLFEPSKKGFEFLNSKFTNENKVSIHNVAVSDFDGSTFFYEEENIGETSSLIQEASLGKSTKVEVLVTCLDSFLSIHNIQFVDFLKIDTEGNDFKVIKGAENYLKENKINIIQFEYNKGWAFAGDTLYAAIKFLEARGYEVFLIKKAGLFKFNYTLFGDFYHYANFAAISKRCSHDFDHLKVG